MSEGWRCRFAPGSRIQLAIKDRLIETGPWVLALYVGPAKWGVNVSMGPVDGSPNIPIAV